jgi:hypothetical protein
MMKRTAEERRLLNIFSFATTATLFSSAALPTGARLLPIETRESTRKRVRAFALTSF